MPPTQVEIARIIATRAHEGQLDKIGAPYILHPQMVAASVQSLPAFAESDDQTQQDVLAAAWLHDVVEDTAETPQSLRAQGISDRAVEAVVALTRNTEIPPDDYYATIKAVPIALMVKTADLASNLAPERVAELDDESREWFAKKYGHALEQLGVDRSVIDTLQADAQRLADSVPPSSIATAWTDGVDAYFETLGELRSAVESGTGVSAAVESTRSAVDDLRGIVDL